MKITKQRVLETSNVEKRHFIFRVYLFETTQPTQLFEATQLFETTQLFGATYLVRVHWNNSSAGLQGRALFSGVAAPPSSSKRNGLSEKFEELDACKCV